MENTPLKSKRQLSAILFADIEGYTSLMQKDEALASLQLKKFQNDTAELVASHNGEVINFYGDGALCVFMNPIQLLNVQYPFRKVFQNRLQYQLELGYIWERWFMKMIKYLEIV